MSRELHDHYFRQAKRDGYRSRAAYKLMEIDDRRRILAAGDCVLDCGCAPGSWLQVAAQRVGGRGTIVGIDLSDVAPLPEPNVHVLVGDLRETPASDLLAPLGDSRQFDVVLSDMAPNTTGDRSIDHHGSVRLCHAVLERCHNLLRSGGAAVLKVLEGEAYPELLARCREMFEQVKGFKPKASRDDSTEMYIIAQGFRSNAEAASTTTATGGRDQLPPRRKPSTGWKK